MRESDLSEPVVALLRKRGYKAYSEIPFRSYRHDWIAVKPGSGLGPGYSDTILMVIEMKLGLNMTVVLQARRADTYADKIYVVVQHRPKISGEPFRYCQKLGVGIFFLSAGKLVRILKGRVQKIISEDRKRQLLARVAKYTPGGVSGKRNEKGKGPAQSVYDLVIEYWKKKENHKATWKEMWSKIPNHYSSPASMSLAFKWVGFRRWLSRSGKSLSRRQQRRFFRKLGKIGRKRFELKHVKILV